MVKFRGLRKLKSLVIPKIFYNKSYSQEGEDMVLKRIFEGKKSGFYVDIGAHHPKRFSNTYFFYKMGWRGINVEPNPDMINVFNKVRPRDINLECGVSDVGANLKYYMFNESALNTFDLALAKERTMISEYNIIAEKEIPVISLENILTENCKQFTTIDFMSIDVEGYDLNVLSSNNWSLYRPIWVLVECLGIKDIGIIDNDIHRFMINHEYQCYAKTVNTFFYFDKSNTDVIDG